MVFRLSFLFTPLRLAPFIIRFIDLQDQQESPDELLYPLGLSSLLRITFIHRFKGTRKSFAVILCSELDSAGPRNESTEDSFPTFCLH
ncbi:Hypothetical protein NTJ_07569 [Nesidiocoris tenuis]|uniref:Secreted protein n=1 Tax=Nesidiocoris tenuis TaxID=355587 RepID=A0ABN7ARB9_9HEMI|nr:Hypothetical protein NTJ_07569 [Nesidiocoris tenuis]